MMKNEVMRMLMRRLNYEDDVQVFLNVSSSVKKNYSFFHSLISIKLF